jgi:acetyl esterase/lipase
VISSAHFPHQGSFINLLGDDATPAEREKLSWEKHIHPNSPPTFLWHTAEDDCVPVENTYLMAMGLSSKNIPHEVHVYPQGHHGLGLCSIGDRRQGACTQWKQQAERWLMDQGF